MEACRSTSNDQWRNLFGANIGRLFRPVNGASLLLCTLTWRWWACGGRALISSTLGWLIYLGGPFFCFWLTSYIILDSRLLSSNPRQFGNLILFFFIGTF